jgi:hypothetical protein
MSKSLKALKYSGRTVRIPAPNKAPQILPKPPMITIMSRRVEKKRPKEEGLINVTK